MDIDTLDTLTKNTLANHYLATGLVVLPQVALPESFVPPRSDVVFLSVGNTCEVYIEADAVYRGSSLQWREIAARPEEVAHTRLVVAARGDFFSGLTQFRQLLEPIRHERIVPLIGHHTPVDGISAAIMYSQRQERNLTDTNAVNQAVWGSDRPIYLDEDVLFEQLKRRVLGQDNALRLIAAVMTRHVARRRPSRPAVLFAAGPSGVGKTKTAESLANVLSEQKGIDTGYQFLRLDMSEYQEAHRVGQLIDAPQRHVGHGRGSQSLDSLRANPHTIVLFDEIEKAHPNIMGVLMNAMDAGRISTADRCGNGREIDCRYAVFMFTSNLDAKGILNELDSRNTFGNRAIEDEVCRRRLHGANIAPEFIGRIDHFLVFRPLSPETRTQIVALAIADKPDDSVIKQTEGHG